MHSSSATAPAIPASNLSARIVPALAAMCLGLALFVTTGFAWPAVIHNATHDMRHSLGLPCH